LFDEVLRPTLSELEHAPAGVAVPVYRAVPADTETPISVFLKLRRHGTGFLLESAEQDGSLGRYSFIGVAPDAVLRAEWTGGAVTTEGGTIPYTGTPLDALRELVGDHPVHAGDLELPGFLGGAVGVLGYDLGRVLEGLPLEISDDTGFPAALFARYHTVVIFDHRKQRLLVVSIVHGGEPRADAYERAVARVEETLAILQNAHAAPAFNAASRPTDVARLLEVARQEPPDAAFLTAAARAKEYVRAGDAIQVVLSRRLAVAFADDPFRLYRALRVVSPSPYMFFLEFPGVAIVGASPEMLLRATDEAAQLAPIAGTRPRGSDAAGDAVLEQELLRDEKERAEHVMLVDLGRNDLGRVCRTGSVHVPRFMQVERFSHVMHLVSTVTGRLSPGVDPIAALAACFPAGTLSGAPKVRAMEIIEELETVRRGAYGGAVGYVGFGGTSLDTCIAIRTVIVRDGTAHLQVGAGIVADSEPQRELDETNAKARALLTALALAGAGGAGSPDSRRMEVIA
jgi:anthranilate synthase component I